MHMADRPPKGEVVNATQTAIKMEVVTCDDMDCQRFAGPLYVQLANGKYDLCSVMDMPASVEDWREDHKTARKRADRARRRGYAFGVVFPSEHEDDIFEINTSKDVRQGRPMSRAYRERPRFSEEVAAYGCTRHAVYRYGVFLADTLVAYLWLYRCGELALVSSILGHGDALDDGIMYLLMESAIGAQADLGGFLVYNRHDSGEEGLRWFKERIGFEEREVAWVA